MTKKQLILIVLVALIQHGLMAELEFSEAKKSVNEVGKVFKHQQKWMNEVNEHVEQASHSSSDKTLVHKVKNQQRKYLTVQQQLLRYKYLCWKQKQYKLLYKYHEQQAEELLHESREMKKKAIESENLSTKDKINIENQSERIKYYHKKYLIYMKQAQILKDQYKYRLFKAKKYQTFKKKYEKLVVVIAKKIMGKAYYLNKWWVLSKKLLKMSHFQLDVYNKNYKLYKKAITKYCAKPQLFVNYETIQWRTQENEFEANYRKLKELELRQRVVKKFESKIKEVIRMRMSFDEKIKKIRYISRRTFRKIYKRKYKVVYDTFEYEVKVPEFYYVRRQSSKYIWIQKRKYKYLKRKYYKTIQLQKEYYTNTTQDIREIEYYFQNIKEVYSKQVQAYNQVILNLKLKAIKATKYAQSLLVRYQKYIDLSILRPGQEEMSKQQKRYLNKAITIQKKYIKALQKVISFQTLIKGLQLQFVKYTNNLIKKFTYLQKVYGKQLYACFYKKLARYFRKLKSRMILFYIQLNSEIQIKVDDNIKGQLQKVLVNTKKIKFIFRQIFKSNQIKLSKVGQLVQLVVSNMKNKNPYVSINYSSRIQLNSYKNQNIKFVLSSKVKKQLRHSKSRRVVITKVRYSRRGYRIRAQVVQVRTIVFKRRMIRKL